MNGGLTMRACSHNWIDPNDPPIARASYAPIIGSGRRQMHPGRSYVCRECGATLVALVADEVPS